MLWVFKIFYKIWVFTAIESYLTFENVFHKYRSNTNFVHSFKCSNFNKVRLKSGINTPVSYEKARNYALFAEVTETEVKPEILPKTSVIDLDYLGHLTGDLIRYSKSVDKNKPEICYEQLKIIFGKFSYVISELFTEPVEVDYQTKLEEIRQEFGEKIDKIEPHHLLKFNPTEYRNNATTFAYEYLVDYDPLNSEKVPRVFRRDLKTDVPKILRKRLSYIINFFSKTLGLFFVTFYQSNLPISELYKESTTLGLESTPQLLEGITLLHLTDNYYGTDLRKKIDKSLELFEYSSIVKQGRNKSFSLIINHFFRNKDYESIFYVIKYITNNLDKKLNGLYLVQFLVSLAHKFKSLKGDSNNDKFIHNIPLNSSVSENDEGLDERKNFKKMMYSELKRWIKQSLELYEKCNLHPFNMIYEFAEILERNYRDLVPGLFRIVTVSSSGDSTVPHGLCDLCNTKINFQDISDPDRFEIFSNMLKTIFNTTVKEFFPLFNFYKFLLRGTVRGKPYTCIIDGQNVGFYKNNCWVLDWNKLLDAFYFFESAGENPLIVLPFRIYNKLMAHLEKMDKPSFDLFDILNESKSIYLTNNYSYDDNYFLLAGIVKFTEGEIKLFDHFINQTSVDESYYASIEYCLSKIKNDQFKKSDKNTIIVTNDRLSNLLIEDVNTEVLNTWKNYSLINFTAFNPKGRLTMGRRINYTFSVVSDNDKFHIPIGYDRIFTNSNEIHKFELGLNIPSGTSSFSGSSRSPEQGKISIKFLNQEETPNKNWIRDNQHLLFDTTNLMPNPVTTDNDIFKESDSRYHRYESTDNDFKHSNDRYRNVFCEIYHNSPEIVEQMFIPNSKSKWLCIDLSRIDSLIENL
uniref:Uncharacterized protein n=1 Tax=Theileria annulata TaxID=5874 RepID=A0A3B0MYU0_THEAN